MFREVTGEELARETARALVAAGLPTQWEADASRAERAERDSTAKADVCARLAGHVPSVLRSCVMGQVGLHVGRFAETEPDLSPELLASFGKLLAEALEQSARQAETLLLGAAHAAAKDAADAYAQKHELLQRALRTRAEAEPQGGPLPGP